MQKNNKRRLDIYDVLRDMAISFKFTPNEKINESVLANQLSISRTPLREAMQKLVSEKLLRWERNKGFFCRPLEEKEIFDLYQFRRMIETEVVRILCRNATDEQLQELKSVIDNSDPYENPEQGIVLDQNFHGKMAELSGNKELAEALNEIGQRIYFIRWTDLSKNGPARLNNHANIVAALMDRDEELAVKTITNHIEQHLEQIAELIREGYGFIYTGNTPNM